MTATWLVLDCNYICYRSYYAIGDVLEFNEEPTSVIYGFLSTLVALMEEFRTRRVVFAFDRGRGKRLELLPTYKGSREKARRQEDEEKQASRKKLRRQIAKLRDVYLQRLGFRNVFSDDGYEADDIIASVVLYSLDETDTAVIVSSDQDLWQLIREGVSCYNPFTRRVMDYDTFLSEWRLQPPLWADVKALAGCSTDDIPGTRGVGEITAAKWFRGEIRPGSSMYERISTDGVKIHNRNVPLVRLPFEGCGRFELRGDNVTRDKWVALADRLGMRSLRELMPGMPRMRTEQKRAGFGF